jgi:hypothetical protein
MRKLFLALLAVAAGSVSLSAADLTGVWTLSLDPDFGGVPDTLDCTFKQSGRKLTADCGGGPNISGEVDGPKVTLLVPTGRNNEQTATLAGELDQREITIAGRWQLADDTGTRDGKFTARKH